jgi:hypothetical protein
MRTAVKYRLKFLVLAIMAYVLGSFIMPQQLPAGAFSFDAIISAAVFSEFAWLRILASSVLYFAIVPTLYWFWVIKINDEPKWKMLIVASLSCLVARYQYPAEIAQYFDFFAWLRYPLIAVLLAIEFYIMTTVIKSLWGARKLTGDPRIHVLSQHEGDEKRRELALMFAHEPASWYYAIPRFSRRHPEAIGHIQLMSGKFWHFALVLLCLAIFTIGAYLLLSDWSETGAIVVATLVIYGSIMFIANYRLSKHYSLYGQNGKLVLNNSWWGMLVVDYADIADCVVGEWLKADDKEALMFGGEYANLQISFNQPQIYFSGLGGITETVDSVYLNVMQQALVLSTLQALLCEHLPQGQRASNEVA